MSFYDGQLKLPINANEKYEIFNRNMTRRIESTLLKYLNMCNLKTVQELGTFFALLDIDPQTICAKKMVEVGGWRCGDCVRNDNTIFCQDCWSLMKDKHKGHNVIFVGRVSGTCDCGDHNCISKEFFCPKHKGIFQNDLEIEQYIKASLGDKLPQKITENSERMFEDMSIFFIKSINEKKQTSKEFFKVVNEFTNCFGILCDMSNACNFIMSDLLLKKYPCKTKHLCLDIHENGGKMIKESFFAHECTCPLIRYLLEFWPGKKEKLLYKFLCNYKMKKIMGLYYFLFYKDYIKDIITDFEDISVQIIFSDVIKIACTIPGLIDYFYNGMIEIFNIFFDEEFKIEKTDCLLKVSLSLVDRIKRYTFMKEVVLKLKCDTIYLLKPAALDYLSNNTNIIFKLIDLTALVHNANKVKVIYPRPSKKPDKYLIELLDVELWLLDILSIYISIFNFGNSSLVKEVFAYYSKVIQKKTKNELAEGEYTFHITLYRGFSMFLNRYCFYEANKNKTNIFKSLQNVSKLMPDFQKCSKKMIKSIYKVFGFITACNEGFFSYYGIDMRQYEYLYYYNPQFIYRDFCLLKYLLALKENAKYLGFKKILSLCQVENSYKPIEDYILKGDKITSPDKWINETNQHYLKFNSKILNIILCLLRNNTCLIWNLSSAYGNLKSNKIKDTLIHDILKSDMNNFHEMTKELIINQLLIKENLAYFTEITDNIFPCLKDFFGDKVIKDIIIELTNKTLTTEKKAKFSLKDDLLYYIDLNYIMYPIHKSKAEKYISDFKSKIVSIFNIHFYPTNKFELKLTDENYNQLYFNEKNFDFLFQFTSFILAQKGYEILIEYFLSVLLNYLSTFLCVQSEHFVFLRQNLKNNHIIEVLENNNLNDDVKKSYCKFIVQKFKEQDETPGFSFDDIADIIKDKNEINEIKDEKEQKEIPKLKRQDTVAPVKKSSKMSMKEKMKNKFKKKNENLSEKLGVDKIIVEDDKKNSESCIFCLKPIEKDDITKPYGVIGDFMCDHYTSNAFFQTIRKEYKKHYDKDLKLPEFDKIYYQPLDRKSIRIISCNHYIHFPCYFKQFMESDLMQSLSIFSCPLCNRLMETFVPLINNYTEEQTKGFLKGFNYDYIFDYGKSHIKEYEKEVKKDADKDKEKEIKKKEEDKKKDINKMLLDLLLMKSDDKLEDEKEEEKEEEKEKEKEEEKEEEEGDVPPAMPVEEKNEDGELFRKTYPDFVNQCKHFVEGFVGMKANVGSLNLEDIFMKPVIAKFTTAFAIQYRDFFCYLDNVEDKSFSIMLWQNFVLCMRLMLKLNIIIKEKYFLRLYHMFKELKTYTFDYSIDYLIQLDNAKLRTSEMLMLISFFFEYEQVEGFEKYVIYLILPFYAFGFFLKSIYFLTSFRFNKAIFLEHLNAGEMEKFLKEDTTLNLIIAQVAKQCAYTKAIMNKNIDASKLTMNVDDNLDLLNLPTLKGKTLLEILDELEILIEADAYDEKKKHLYNTLKYELNYKEIFLKILEEHIDAANKEQCDEILSPSLFGSCIPCIFNFIDLPELAIDFEYENYNKVCQICKVKGKRSLICLDCGRKVCDSRSCLADFKGETMASFIAHCKICGGGRTAYLQSDDCSVLFISNKAVFKKFVPLYVNEFGEGISKRNFGKEFKLNKEEVKKALKMFTEYSYSNAEIIT